MRSLQIVAVALMVGLNGLDGFDVLSISYASNGITREWGLEPGVLGIVLSMELFGMAIGSIVLGGVADRIGRRKTILGCLVTMAIGMFMVTTVDGLVGLSAWRVLTGLGIGGLLSSITAITAEFSNARRRALCVSIMAIGYPLGALLGGLVVAPKLGVLDWRFVFYFGAAVTAAFIPLVYFLVPESVHWLARKQPENALTKINHTFKRLGHAAVTALPKIEKNERGATFTQIFGPTLLATTLIVTIAYFLHIVAFYFIIKWVPNIISEMGFSDASAGGVLNWVNVGGATGGAILGLLTTRIGVKPLTIGVLILSAVAVIMFGRSAPDLFRLSMLCMACGFFINAGIVGLYTIFAEAFPTQVRAFGTGFAIGVGRGGSLLAPVVAGFLFQAEFELPAVALIMSLGPLLAATILCFLKLKPEQPKSASAEPQTAEFGASLSNT